MQKWTQAMSQRTSSHREIKPLLLLLLAPLLGACTSSGGLGFATNSAPSSETSEYLQQFAAIDRAGTGRITLDQAIVHYAEKFTALDVNRDSKLDSSELDAIVPVLSTTNGNDLLFKLDNNSNRSVSEQEFAVIANWLFRRSRSNDATLTLDDARTPLPRAQPPTPPGKGPGGKPPNGSPTGFVRSP
jgi:hypothetical protein